MRVWQDHGMRSRRSKLKGHAIAATTNARALALGYRFAAGLPASDETGPGDPGQLERYFDALAIGPGLWKWRHYFDVYERHLGKYVGKEVRLAEIGVFSGGSLGMWRDYLGPRAEIYGVDLEPACATYEGPQTRIFIGDQADPAFWADFIKAVPSLDVAIDDGGHETHQQIATLEAVLPHLRSGGVYLCEDIHGTENAFHAYIDGLARQLHQMGGPDSHRFPANPLQSAIASIHSYPFVTVIEKRTRPLDVLEAPRRGTQWQPFYSSDQLGRDL